VVVFWVNATGSENTYEFFVYANKTSDLSISNITNRWNVTIQAPNQVPETPSPEINSTDGSNKTTQNLTCFATISDPDADRLNVTVKWYNNSVEYLTVDYNNSYLNGTFFSAVLDSGNTTKYENWSCGMRLYDGKAYSDWANSSVLTILNSPPTVTLIIPSDNNITTNRTPEFSWTGSDDDSDSLEYEINITCWEAGSIVTAGSVFKDKNEIGNSTSYTPSVGDYLKCLSDNNQNYKWTVRAYDGSVYGDWASLRNLSVQSLLTISLPQNSINFGKMNLSDSENTSDDSPLPIILRNDGNAELNISTNFTDLWITQPNPSSYFQYKIRNTTSGCFVQSGTQTSWIESPSITAHAIERLNFTSGYQIGCNNVSVDIYIKVPEAEPSGNKSAIITLTSKLAEPKIS